jgi:hypothetical protein
MKKNLKKFCVDLNIMSWLTSFIILAAILIMPLRLNAQGGKTNFSGTWAYNESKSQAGQGNFRGGAGQMIIKQEGNNLSIDRVRTNQSGESVTTTEKYTLDGKESVNTSRMGPSKSIVKWSADGKTLDFATTRTFERDGNKREMKSSESWTLTDAKTLSIVSSFTTQDGERKSTRVYDKK